MAAKRWFRVTALLATLTVALTMILGSCGSKAPRKGGWTPQTIAALFSGGFSAGADITLGDLTMTGDLSREGSKTTLSLTAPEHLEGLSFAVDGGKVAVTYKGLTVQADSMPVPALGRAVALVMDALTRPELLTAGSADNGADTFSGKTENGVFTLTMDKEAPLSLEIPELQLSAAFTGFTPSAQGGSPIPQESNVSGTSDASGISSAPSDSSSAPDVSGVSGESGDASSAPAESTPEDVSSLQQGEAD